MTNRTPIGDACNLFTISMQGPQAFAVPLFADTHLNRWSCLYLRFGSGPFLKVWLTSFGLGGIQGSGFEMSFHMKPNQTTTEPNLFQQSTEIIHPQSPALDPTP